MRQNIKSFIYLDDYKLYSLSSQIFQGFTEYIISGNIASRTEEESQKGMFASGKGTSYSRRGYKTHGEYYGIWISR